jgi:hypothetical protein
MRMSEGYMRKLRWMLMVAVIGTAMSGHGQESGKKEAGSGPVTAAQQPDERTFIVSFVARELDENGKVVNSRRYDTMAGARPGRASIRTGGRLPIAVTGKGGANEVTYVDVGVSFDVANPQIVGGNRLAMAVSAEISSLDPATVNAANQPTIRQNRWTGDVEVPIGGHRVIFSSDDLGSKRTMQIEAAVTRAN